MRLTPSDFGFPARTPAACNGRRHRNRRHRQRVERDRPVNVERNLPASEAPLGVDGKLLASKALVLANEVREQSFNYLVPLIYEEFALCRHFPKPSYEDFPER